MHWPSFEARAAQLPQRVLSAVRAQRVLAHWASATHTAPSTRAPATRLHASGKAFSSKALQLTSLRAAAQPAMPNAVAALSDSARPSTQVDAVRAIQASALP